MLFLVLVADFFVLVLVNGIVIFSFLVIFVFVNENHTSVDQPRFGQPEERMYLHSIIMTNMMRQHEWTF